MKSSLVLALEQRAFPGHLVGERFELYHLFTPCMVVIVAVFLLYGNYVFFFYDLKSKAPKKQVDKTKAWALFLKFDSRGQFMLNFEDMTCFMSIVNTNGYFVNKKTKTQEEWSSCLYQRICALIDVNPMEGLHFDAFLQLYRKEIQDCDENYHKVFEVERSDVKVPHLEEDPLENITAVQFSAIDPKFSGRCGFPQFTTCFQACCEQIGIPEPHEEWYWLAFSNFVTEKDTPMAYSEFHQCVQHYLDHCRAVKANITNSVHLANDALTSNSQHGASQV